MKQLPYGLGIIIPCTLIAFGGWGMIFHVLPHREPGLRNVWYFSYAMVWISYGLAIFTDPGRVSPKLSSDLDFTIWCEKCNSFKPERAHHCRQCGRCVLKMDHHCPWTANCVGHANLPHFVRFLAWTAFTTSWTTYEAVKFDLGLWWDLEMPAYLYSTTTIVAGILLVPVIGLVSLTIWLLFIRVISNLLQGKSQIEDWEIDRVNVLSRRKLAPRVEFPFDVDPWSNAVSALGPIWTWPLPWSGPATDGHHFEKLFPTENRWPPDSELARNHEFYRMDRWISPEGENLADFGVDVVAERGQHVGGHTANDTDDETPLSEIRLRRVAA